MFTYYIQMNPQFYAFRWITLLLTQEFELSTIMRIWDYLLSNPSGVQVDFSAFINKPSLAIFVVSKHHTCSEDAPHVYILEM